MCLQTHHLLACIFSIMFYFHSSKYYLNVCLHEHLTMQDLSHNWSCKQLHFQIRHKLTTNASIGTTYLEVDGNSRQLITIANDWSWGVRKELCRSSRDDRGWGIWKWGYSVREKVYWRKNTMFLQLTLMIQCCWLVVKTL